MTMILISYKMETNSIYLLTDILSIWPKLSISIK